MRRLRPPTEVINPGTVTPPRYPNVDPGDGSGVYVTHYPLGPHNAKKEPITAGNVFDFLYEHPDQAMGVQLLWP